MRIVFAGTTGQAAMVLKHLANSQHEVVAVVTRLDAPVGRKATLTRSPVADQADSLNIRVIKTNKLDAEADHQIRDLQPDLGVVIAYGALLKTSTLELPSHGWLNLHFSLLPEWRGAAPVQHSILSGNRITGVSIFKLDEGMDTGPLLKQVQTEIQPDENSGELLNRLTHIGISALDECLAKVESGIADYHEQVGTGSIAGKLTRADAIIDWHQPADNLALLVRAMNPEPMSWTSFRGTSFRVLEARPIEINGLSDHQDINIGYVFKIDDRVCVRCGDTTTLELIRVQPSGKNSMLAADWLRGLSGIVMFDV